MTEGQAPEQTFSPEAMARRIYFHHGIDENKPVLREDILASLRKARADAIEEAANVVEGGISELQDLAALYNHYDVTLAISDQIATLQSVAHRIRGLAPKL